MQVACPLHTVVVSAFAHCNGEVQGANVDENAGLIIEKREPTRLIQRVGPCDAGKWDTTNFILQHLPNNFDIDLLVH